ncbi:MAG TPA: tRNA glutamyl-Q(34) synthetase GluQRS [Burkholderiales bacterium]|nr:tRNA glutamyl-Q(34) synthetase GluQRS [Burkholderiales bacterium]
MAIIKKPTSYRGRFAPSPTGPLHFGSLIAAVGSFLEARSRKGEWLVRIEDIDPPREEPGASDEILRTLETCGMEWDGEIVYQSTRRDAYHAALHSLRGHGLVYPCACSRREIADSAIEGIDGPVYPGTCRNGLPKQRSARVWRVKTDRQLLEFTDTLQGYVAQHLETDVGDYVLYRADRVYAYQLAVVVDDAEQGITDIVRGADLLSSTPRQLYLQQLLGYSTPKYMHLPVALDSSGKKLSKQTFAPALGKGQEIPWLYHALRFLGQNPPPRLANANLNDFWTWAVLHWDAKKIPRARALQAH